MIYPTARAVLLAAAGAGVSLAVVAAAPDLWLLGGAWILAVAALIGADAASSPGRAAVSVNPRLPGGMGLGREVTASFDLAFARRPPRFVE